MVFGPPYLHYSMLTNKIDRMHKLSLSSFLPYKCSWNQHRICRKSWINFFKEAYNHLRLSVSHKKISTRTSSELTPPWRNPVGRELWQADPRDQVAESTVTAYQHHYKVRNSIIHRREFSLLNQLPQLTKISRGESQKDSWPWSPSCWTSCHSLSISQ